MTEHATGEFRVVSCGLHKGLYKGSGFFAVGVPGVENVKKNRRHVAHKSGIWTALNTFGFVEVGCVERWARVWE